jgi:hypothetical protein
LDDSADPASETVTLATFTPTSGGGPWGSITGLAPAAVTYQVAGTQSVWIKRSNGTDACLVNMHPSAPIHLLGGSGVNTLIGPNMANTWVVNAANGGVLDGTLAFANVANLVGGPSANTFQFLTGGSLSGSLNGGGAGTLDYSGFVGDVVVDLPLDYGAAMGGGIYNVYNVEDVIGSVGNDLLVGDAQTRMLSAGTGRSIVIAGAGTVQVTGSVNANSIVIGGTTAYDTNLAALQLIMTEWLRTDLNFRDLLYDISSGGAGVANSVLTGTGIALNNATVFANNASNTLIEPSTDTTGQYWFFADAADTIPFLKRGKYGDHVTKV